MRYSTYLNDSRRQVCVFLPEIPYVKIKRFELPEVRRNNIIRTAEYREIISTVNNHQASMPNHETSTCLMLFSTWLPIAIRWASVICERYSLYLVIIHI
jgi:hypothetical protein